MIVRDAVDAAGQFFLVGVSDGVTLDDVLAPDDDAEDVLDAPEVADIPLLALVGIVLVVLTDDDADDEPVVAVGAQATPPRTSRAATRPVRNDLVRPVMAGSQGAIWTISSVMCLPGSTLTLKGRTRSTPIPTRVTPRNEPDHTTC